MLQPSLIRVLIVDDHAVIRSGIKALLAFVDDVVIVGEAQSGEEALAYCQKLRPDVVLMDLDMPQMNGAAAVEVLRKRYPKVQVIMLTNPPGEQNTRAALSAGAVNCLPKDAGADALLRTIRTACA